MFYVYQHSIPNTQRVFYVGKGSGKRAFSNKDRNTHWKNIVNKYGFTVDFVCSNLDEELAFFAEQELIDVYKKRGLQLANMTAGGDGGGSCVVSEETKQKLSVALKGRKKPEGFSEKLKQRMIGKKATEETKKRLRESHFGVNLGEKHGMFGKFHTQEARQKMSASKVGKKRSVEVVENLKKLMTGCFWITNGTTSKRIKGDFVLPYGWKFGKRSSKGAKP